MLLNENSLRKLIKNVVNGQYSKKIKYFLNEQTTGGTQSPDPNDAAPESEEEDVASTPAPSASEDTPAQPDSQPKEEEEPKEEQSTTPSAEDPPEEEPNQDPVKKKNYGIILHSHADAGQNVNNTFTSSNSIMTFKNDKDEDVSLEKGKIYVKIRETVPDETGGFKINFHFYMNIDYIPCYNISKFKPSEEEQNAFNEFKKEYLQKDEDVQKRIQAIFAGVFATRHLQNAIIEEKYNDQKTFEGKNLLEQIQNLTNHDQEQILTDFKRKIEHKDKEVFNNFSENVKNNMISIIEKIIYFQSDDHITFDDCIPADVPQTEETPTPVVQAPELSCWYRFPQLNGGYFEMAESLLNEDKMNNIQDTSRKYKQYEKQGELYGLIEKDSNNDAVAAAAQAEIIRNFFKADEWTSYVAAILTLDSNQENKFKTAINSFTKKDLGTILDTFFKNRMVRVGEYYLIDNSFLSFCALYVLQKIGINVKEQCTDAYKTYVTERSPKIVKAKYKISDLPDNVENADASKLMPNKLSIKQMFHNRAKNDLKKYNQKGDQSPEALQAFQKSRDLNLSRRNREKVYDNNDF